MRKKNLKNLSLNLRKVATLKHARSVKGGSNRVCGAETVIICPGPATDKNCESVQTDCFSCGIC